MCALGFKLRSHVKVFMGADSDMTNQGMQTTSNQICQIEKRFTTMEDHIYRYISMSNWEQDLLQSKNNDESKLQFANIIDNVKSAW